MQKSLTLKDNKNGTCLKISSSEYILQRVSVALAQVKTGNTSEYLLNETPYP